MRDDLIRRLVLTAAVCLATGGCTSGSPEGGPEADARLQALFEDHRLFELHDAVTERSPALYRGAVAAAFNEPEAAEEPLRDAIRAGGPHADAAYRLLAQIYIRSGQYRRFAALYDEWSRAIPDSPGVRDERENFEKFRARPDQINGALRSATITGSPDGYPIVPAVVDGRAGEFIFDTGAWQSALTTPLAAKLGIEVNPVPATLTDLSGTRVEFRTAVAREVTVGGMQFRDVSFAVIEPGGAFEGVELGIIGMPIILALERYSWSKDGTITLGTPSAAPAGARNLVFDRHRLVLRAQILDRTVPLALDSGANSTDLNANFADTFRELVERGKTGTQTLHGVGGSQTFESIELPELIIRIGSRLVTLKPAHITLQRNATAGGICCVGNAGHDLLKQGQGFTIDLRSMSLQLD